MKTRGRSHPYPNSQQPSGGVAMIKGRSLIMRSYRTPAFAIGLLCSVCAAAAAEPDAAVVSFDFTNQRFSSEFIDWVAQYGARKTFVVTDEKTLSDIVQKECGQASEFNLRLFNLAISQPIPFETGANLLVPPCLPTAKASSLPRIAADKDVFWKYYRSGKNDLDNLVFNDRPKETYSAEKPPKSEDGTTSGTVTETAFGKGIYDEFIVELTSAKDPADASARGKLAVANFWKRKALIVGAQSLDSGQLAYDASFLKEALTRFKIDLTTEAILDFGLASNPAFKDVDRSQVVALAETAASRWSNADLAKSTELAAQATTPETPTAGDFMDNVTWFTPDAAQLSSKKLKDLRPGDLIVAPSVVSQKVEIPIDKTLIAAPDTQADVNVPATFEDSPSDSPQLEERQTFSVDELAASQCHNAGTSKWESAAFLKMFKDAAFRTRLAVAKAGRTSAIEAKIVVADSGFVAAEERGPFAATLANFGPSEERFQMPAKEFSYEHRTHGTAVTGLAIGGPQLWPLASALGIKLEVIPRRIFDPRLVGEKIIPFFMYKYLDKAAGTDADIYNLSFGSRDKNAMDVFRAKFFGKSMNKLFVIAAGNNNLNDGTQGVDVGNGRIFPQFWAGNESGANVLLVSALDGDKLAAFSNYSSSRVSLAAPGCALPSWKPTDDDAKYDEKAVTGTSFSAPVVSYVAALVKALSPPDRSGSTWTRARLIASADLTSVAGVEHGRVFNPVKAISLYDDVVELSTASSQGNLLFGRLQVPEEWPKPLHDICVQNEVPDEAVLLKFARDPTATSPKFFVYYMQDDTLYTTATCTPKPNIELPLIAEDGKDETIKIDDVKDIVFRIN